MHRSDVCALSGHHLVLTVNRYNEKGSLRGSADWSPIQSVTATRDVTVAWRHEPFAYHVDRLVRGPAQD